MKVRAVTFDYWNTLIAETDAPVELRKALWAAVLADAGSAVSSETLTEAFKQGWAEFDRRWRRNEQSSAELVASHAVDHLGVEVAPKVRADLVEAYREASRSVPRELLPDVGVTFERLKAAGVGIGVVCDVGTVDSHQLRAWLADHGVLDLIDHCSFSDEVGVFKPDPRIFRHALSGLGGVSPEEAAHVGDLRRTDVVGARRVGMTAVRYTGGREDTEESEDEADHVIAGHLELFDVLLLP